MLQNLDLQKELRLLDEKVIVQLNRIGKLIPHSINNSQEGMEILIRLRVLSENSIRHYHHRALVFGAIDWLNTRCFFNYEWHWEIINENRIQVSKLRGNSNDENKIEAIVLTSSIHYKLAIDFQKVILKKLISESTNKNKFFIVDDQDLFIHACNHLHKIKQAISIVDLRNNDLKSYMQ
jgi:hypothetical protein